MTPIKSIEEELADCRAAFAAHPNTPFAWCIHHEKELEAITEPIENRIKFILEKKDVKEQAIRFRNLRPCWAELPATLVEAGEDYCKAWEDYCKAWEAYEKAREAYEKAHVRRAKAWVARDKAWEACWKAGKACWKAGKAYDKAYEPYKAQLSELHTRDWPDHTWTGKSIFPQ